MHRKLRSHQVVPTAEDLHNLLLGYYLGEADFREVAKAFNTRIIVAEEWSHYELVSIYAEIKAILEELRKDKSVYKHKHILWNWRSSLRYRMNKVCPTLFKVTNQFSHTPKMFCIIGTKGECEKYVASKACRKDLQFSIVPCIGDELQYEADHCVSGICLNRL